MANVAAVLAPTGVLFGASILGSSGPHTWLARRMLGANNLRGIFDNLGDTQDGLGEILGASFEHVEVETVGSMAIYAATNPARSRRSFTTPHYLGVLELRVVEIRLNPRRHRYTRYSGVRYPLIPLDLVV